MRAILFLSALLASAAATALPPPVPINVILFTPGEPDTTSAAARQLLNRLAAENWIGLGQVTAAGPAIESCTPSQGRDPDRDCLAAALEKTGAEPNSVVMMAHRPGGQGNQHQFVCVGPDRLRGRTVQVHLAEGGYPTDAAAAAARGEVASCLIGALHGPRGERG